MSFVLLHKPKLFTTFTPSKPIECIMDHTTPQPIELHCRAVLHLSPEHFTIRDRNEFFFVNQE